MRELQKLCNRFLIPAIRKMGNSVPKEAPKRYKSSDSANSSSSTERIKSIHESLVRERDHKSNFDDIFDVIDEIGRGGLCKVYKIQKRFNKIGGSSRADNVRVKKTIWRHLSPHTPIKSQRKRFGSTGHLSQHQIKLSTISSREEHKLPLQQQASNDDNNNNNNYGINYQVENEENDYDEDTSANLSCSPAEYMMAAYPSSHSIREMEEQESIRVTQQMTFAMKEINLAMVPPDKVEQLKSEVEILKALDHKNIIKAYETFQPKNTKKILIIMELCTGGDLHSRLPYTEVQVAKMVRQILSAVAYLHSKSIIHRDIKLENIMFENEHPDSIIRLIDFGLSKEYSQKDHILSERVGTLYSMSPETLLGDYTTQADLWSIGVCTYMLLANGQQPFEGKTPKQMVARILLAKYNFDAPIWAGISDTAKDFIRKLLVVKPEDRMNAKEAKLHPWLQDLSSHHSLSSNSVNEEFKQRVRDCIIRYAQHGEFLKLALNVIAKKSSSEEIFELRRVFDEFDKNNSGTLDMEEFKAALGHANNISDADVEQIFRKIDVNRNNEINYTEFLAAALETQGMIEEYRLAEAFDLMDSDDSGYISRANLKKILGENADDKYINKLIAEADFKKDGKISYGEFLRAFNRSTHALVYNMYETDGAVKSDNKSVGSSSHSSLHSDSSAEEVLRRYGIIKGLRRAFNSSNNLMGMGNRDKSNS